ncbi:MAG: phosphoribosylanthranilate isomerase [Oscillospiraceae bacterium]|nr:phosphoribosylanthranilate isomerase [Oscillospiraceae bacterium]
MTKIKICGLSRPCDIEYVNEAKPDFCGFIINVPKSKRNVSPDTVRQLAKNLSPDVKPVGVFVNAPMDEIAALTEDGTLAYVQLQGKEDEAYIAALRERIHVPIIQAFKVSCPEDVAHAQQSSADYILLDNGSGGTGKTFDWSHLRDIIRPYILAGGPGPDNLGLAVSQLAPWGVDLSSGVETDGFKDKNKVLAAV